MPTMILRERVYFTGAESLYRELEALDSAFRRAAYIVEYDYEEEHTIGGSVVKYSTMLLEAEIDVSP